jgi:multiple sugar transport system permease protein
VAIAVIAVVILVPIAYMLLLSVTPDAQVGAGALIPTHWALSNYVDMWSSASLAQGIVNSLIISGSASIIAVILAVGAAYVLTRFTFLGRRPYLYTLVGLQAVPGVMLLLPLFAVLAWIQHAILHFQLIGTYEIVIVTYLTFALPFATWILVSYLGSIPLELEEAALVDGATRLRALWHVVVPLALPGMVVALVFSFLTGWNDVLFASVLTHPDTRTLAYQLQVFSTAQEGGALPLYGQLMGAAAISALPVVVLYMIFQRYLIGGLTVGGVKG